MLRVAHIYQLPEPEREQALTNALENPDDRKIVEEWIKNHPVETAMSPMLQNLRGRVTAGLPQRENIFADAPSIENEILSGKFPMERFKASPQDLQKYIDLIRTHLELNTITLPAEILPFLLDHLPTNDLIELFTSPSFNPTSTYLSNSQMFRVSALLATQGAPTSCIVSPLFTFRQIFQYPREDLRSAIRAINNLAGFTLDEKNAALAHYMELHKVSLKDITPYYSYGELLHLAPHLRYVDLRDFDTVLGNQLLKKCANLNTLCISDAKMIEDVESLPLCQKLDCDDCTGLTALPALPLCKELYCNDCTRLTALPALPLCQKLSCDDCISLTALPDLPLCQELSCADCISLTALPDLPLCQKLFCDRCTGLTALPALPLCQKLYCDGCTRLAGLPELPWNAQVYSGDENSGALKFASLDIDIERFFTEPVALLLMLGKYLLNNKPFPNIYYFMKGVRSEAVDIGGVRRDFVTKLCTNLFRQGETGKFLKIDSEFSPQATSNEEEDSFRAFGRLLSLCYQENSYFKTGPLFNEKVYSCMIMPNPGSSDWLLKNYLQLKDASDAVKQFIDLTQSAPNLAEKDLTTLAYLINPEVEDTSVYTREYFISNRATLGEMLLRSANEDMQLKAISWMAQEMGGLTEADSKSLKDRIEGVLSSNSLKSKLTWALTKPQDPRFIKTQEYLRSWIETHDNQLEKFVYAVTGNRALCAENLKIEIFDRDKNFIPLSHTCFFSLELSANYESQEVFDQKIAYFLEHALAGSGFTLA